MMKNLMERARPSRVRAGGWFLGLLAASWVVPPSAFSQPAAPSSSAPGRSSEGSSGDATAAPANAAPAPALPAPAPAAPAAPAPAAAPCACVPPTVLPQPSRRFEEPGRRGTALRVARVAVETVLAAGLGAVTGVAGAYAGLNVDLLSGHEAGPGLSLGTALLYPLGVAPGVWLGGYAMGGDGSFGWTLLGSAVGTGGSAALLALSDKPPMLAFAATVPIVAAIVGYELSSHRRRAKAAPRPAAQGTLLPGVAPADSRQAVAPAGVQP